MMKNIYKIFTLLFFVAFSACDSTEDLFKELDDLDTGLEYVLDYTLNSDDYDLVDQGFGNFSSEDDAKSMIPTILDENYPQFGAGSAILVSYDLYSPIRINNAVEFTMEGDDYDAVGERFPNLNSEGDIFKSARYKYPNPEEYDVITLNYDYWAPGLESRTSKLTYIDDEWSLSYAPSDADYTFMGQDRFKNFDSRTEARNNISVLFDQLFQFDESGDVRTSVFRYYNGDETVDFMIVLWFDGSNWNAIHDVASSSLKFGHDGSKWVPDNTIKYTLSPDDFNAIAATYESSNSDGSASVERYGNFDFSLWSSDQILEAIADRLTQIFPTVEGQKYLVSYRFYDNGNGTGSLYVVYQGGSYVVFTP